MCGADCGYTATPGFACSSVEDQRMPSTSLHNLTPVRCRTVIAWVVSAMVGISVFDLPKSRAVDDSQSLNAAIENLVQTHCLECHDSDEPEGGLDLERLHTRPVTEHLEAWEGVLKRLRTGQMPPAGHDRPDAGRLATTLTALERILDDESTRHLRPGRTGTFRRLTRIEYRNAIRDLLSLDIDVESLLPADEMSHGFDNVTVGSLSPTLLNRYLAASMKISRTALGRVSEPDVRTIRIKPDVTQEKHVDGLPLGTRGGTLVNHYFPATGVYEIRVRLARDRNEEVEGLKKAHEMDVLIDSRQVDRFTVRPPRSKSNNEEGYSAVSHASVDLHLVSRLEVNAGTHQVGVTFLKQPSSLLETKRQPLNVHFNMYRHPRLAPAVYQITINGPFESTGASPTPTRQRLLGDGPTTNEGGEKEAHARLSQILRFAIRRPVTRPDMEPLMFLFRQGREQEGYEAGMELALSSILIHPEFLFRIERDPEGLDAGSAYRISDLELASRLSFFLWSSIPDAQLLRLAEDKKLRDPGVLQGETRRMLADPRARALATNFAGQWLYLRNLESLTPDGRLFADFDDNLRQAFRQETELFFEHVLLQDKSVLDFLKADYTFLNERLAKHYEIPHVYGSRFRRVTLGLGSHRGGLLRHGSILTVTSYATRTSPVLRGKWVLENLLGIRPPPPPGDVPALKDNDVADLGSVRQRLEQHRSDPACASCHALIDPAGFALENFDAVGRWRTRDNETLVDASGGLPGGRSFVGVDGLEQELLNRPELFVATMSEKLLTYALGRGHEAHDAAAIRKVVRAARSEQYRFSALLLALVQSTPFQMRTTQ